MHNRIQLFKAANDLGLTAQRYKKFASEAGVGLIRVGEKVFLNLEDHERISEIVRKAEDMAGLTPLYIIAERYGVMVESVRRYLVKEGFEVHTRFSREKGRWILATGEDAIAHIESRFEVPDAGYLSARSAAKRIGTTLGAALHWMRTHGREVKYWNTLTSKKPYIRIEDWEEYVREEYSSYVPPYLAANQFGETVMAVRILMDRYDVPFKQVKGDKLVDPKGLEPFIKKLPKYHPRPNAMRNRKMGVYELSILIRRAKVLMGEQFARALYAAHVEWRSATGGRVVPWETLMKGAPR